jgi:hypothetical protein
LSPAQLQAAYPRIADFQNLAHDLDPDRKFSNAYVDRYVFGDA